MDEKLGIRFRKIQMQPFMQNYAYFSFLFEKGSKQFILCMLLDKL